VKSEDSDSIMRLVVVDFKGMISEVRWPLLFCVPLLDEDVAFDALSAPRS
jgi:hypothetical protein